MDFNTVTLADYLDGIAAATSTPGGGSVTAVTAAQAAGLLSMVCNFTLGKEKFKSVEERVTELLRVFEKKRAKLFSLATEDTVVFEKVMSAYKLSKDDKSRQEQIQTSLKASSEVPFEVFQICRKLIPFTDELEKIGNPMLVSDVIVARLMLKNCMECSVENVEINLTSITDQDFCSLKRAAMNK